MLTTGHNLPEPASPVVGKGRKRPRHPADMRSRLRAALETGDDEELIQACRQVVLDSIMDEGGDDEE